MKSKQNKMAAITPKAVLYQKYGSKAVYKIEELKETIESDCPGLFIPQQVQTLYRCCLELPELVVTSDVFTRKKDAEQSAAKLAIDKLGIQPRTTNHSVEEAWAELTSRLSYLFSVEFLSSSHPLVGHFKESFKRDDMFGGRLPVSVLSACDSKLVSLCKIINPEAESNPVLNLALVMKAASCSDFFEISERKLWIWKKNLNSHEVLQRLVSDNVKPIGTIALEALLIPFSAGKPIKELTMDIAPDNYYMDVIAQKLGARDCSELLITRSIGKSTSETRVYYVLPEKCVVNFYSCEDSLPLTSDLVNMEAFNTIASYLSGQMVFGDAILATIGYTWRSADLIHEHVSLGTYYRMLLERTPDGNYKLSREALLAAELPMSFTTHSNWRGMLPRDLLNAFCRQHKLLEPVFSTKCLHLCSERAGKTKMRKSVNESGCASEIETVTCNKELHDHGSFTCEVRILTKTDNILIESTSKDLYRKQSDAIHSVALQILNWLAAYFKDLNMPLDRISDSGNTYGLSVHSENFYKEFMLCRIVHGDQQGDFSRQCFLLKKSITLEEDEIASVDSSDINIFPTAGSLVSVSYSVCLQYDYGGGNVRECLEENNDFEFEVGSGEVLNGLEACVTQLAVNQAAHFTAKVPSRNLMIAVSEKFTEFTSWQSLEDRVLEYNVKLLRVTQPLEDRIEQALFSPPLSKQRVEYALRHIHDFHATSLVDFGCGSGSLLTALLERPSSLKKMVGVDLSQKSLSRAAKILHSKLSRDQDPTKSSIVLFYGSITDFDSRIYGFDIGTCLEVIEHMEEDQAHLFGDVVLSCLCPRVLIVSTPNYEYNALLQGSGTSNKEEDTGDKEPSLQFKFRNHDHKFEWTREQFEDWASCLALKHNYTVEFGGVGGMANVEPGFASQIAVFKSKKLSKTENDIQNDDSSQIYKVIWEWNNKDLAS